MSETASTGGLPTLSSDDCNDRALVSELGALGLLYCETIEKYVKYDNLLRSNFIIIFVYRKLSR